MLIKSLDELKKEYIDALKMSVIPDSGHFKKYPVGYGYWIDKSKSVEWNEEQMAIKNEEYEQEKERLIKLRDKEWRELSDKIARRLLETSQIWYTDEIKLSIEQLNLIVLYAMEYAPDSYEPTNIFDSIMLNLNLAVDLNIR